MHRANPCVHIISFHFKFITPGKAGVIIVVPVLPLGRLRLRELTNLLRISNGGRIRVMRL